MNYMILIFFSVNVSLIHCYAGETFITGNGIPSDGCGFYHINHCMYRRHTKYQTWSRDFLVFIKLSIYFCEEGDLVTSSDKQHP